MNAEIICIGTELLLGNIVNTDATDVAQALSELGISVYRYTAVGDNPERLTEVVQAAAQRADLLITTGGLGPTLDDLSKETVAGAFGKKLVRHPECEAEIRAYFDKIGTVMTPNNLQQAMLPESCTVLHNAWGTAPGCVFESGGVMVIMLPGPPRECRAMLKHRVVPYLKSRSKQTIHSRYLHVFGMGESGVEYALHDLMAQSSNPTVAPYAKEGEVMLRVTAAAADEDAAEAMIEPVVAQIRQTLGDLIYTETYDTLEQTCLELLKSRAETFSTAESCTGGLVAKRITDLPGSSAVFTGGVVAYTEQAKQNLLGVPAELIAREGVVSAPVAEAMARGAAQRLGSKYGIGITGLAGPDGDGSGKPIGLVYVALWDGQESFVRELHSNATRERIRLSASNHAFDMLRRVLTGQRVVL